MKRITILSSLIIYSWNYVSAQSSFQLKAYHNSDFYKRSESSVSNFSRFSFAIGLDKANWHHEVELSFSEKSNPFDHNTRISENENTDINFFSLHYELNKILIKSENLQFSTGVGFSYYDSETESNPRSPVFPTLDEYQGATLNLIPRVIIPINTKLSLDLNLKLGLFDVHNSQSKVLNPALPERQQVTVDETVSTLLPYSYSFRFGLSYLVIKGSNKR